MKGVGWEASKSLDVQQAKKAGELISEVRSDPETQNALLTSDISFGRQIKRCHSGRF